MGEPAESPPLPTERPWCRVCGTSHQPGGKCPGELLATGPERHGWRVHVDGARGPEAFGVLVAPCGKRWRARILTYPRILWAVPGGSSMKFVGNTPAEAENRAIGFIKLHCRMRGLQMRETPPKVESGAVDLEQDPAAANSAEVQASQRELRTIPVRFGTSRPTESAATEDVSEGGLFVVTASPLPDGTEVVMRIEIDGFGIPLRGIVRWSRSKPVDGRSVGMGIQLNRPHARYVKYVRQQRAAEAAEETVEAE